MTNIENVKINCPFCDKQTISATFIPSVIQAHTSRTTSNKTTKFYQTKEKYEIQSGCSNCGKSQKEIEKALKEGKPDVDKEKKILERLKQQGFPNEITTRF